MHVIHRKLLLLDINKASGPDNLPPILFKRCATALTFPLFTLFNQSIKTGNMPKLWKLAHVTPIHKSGSTHEVTNYRPISMLSIPAKLLDNIIADELFERYNDIIIPEQHGFFKKRSTVTNLIDYTESLQRCIDEAGQTDVVYTDFSRAFDKINHKILLRKIQDMGINGNMIKWFNSYFTDRKQMVKIGECSSDIINVSSSVVQGSHLGPILFSLFINDIKLQLENVNFAIYADDLKIWKKITVLEDAIVLQDNLNRVASYVKENKLSLNIRKCVVNTFTKKKSSSINYDYQIDGTKLVRKESMKDLGVIYDSKLTFNEHIEAICEKARRMLGFIMRTGKHFTNPFTFRTLYNCLVRSNVEYASIIWNPHTLTHKQKLERIQHKFLTFIGKRCFNMTAEDINYHSIENRINIDTLEVRREFTDLKFTIKTLHKEIDGQTFLHHFTRTNTNQTRNQRVFKIKKSRTDTGLHSVCNRLISTFNRFCPNDEWLRKRPTDERIKLIMRNIH